MVRSGSKNGHHKVMCLKEIALCAPKLVTILDLIVDVIGRHQYDQLIRKTSFALTMNKIFI